MSKKLILGSGGIFWDNPADPILEHIYSLIDDKTAPRLVYLPTAGRDNPNDESEVNDWAFRHGFASVTHLYLSRVPYILCPHFEDWPEFLDDVKKQEYDAIGLDNDIIFSIVDGHFTIVDSHRNPRHTAYWMPADEGFKPHNLYREPQYLDAMAFEA